MDQLQELLNKSAKLSNELLHVNNQIKKYRGTNPPVCWGHDDCSINMLSTCPWRIDCGSI